MRTIAECATNISSETRQLFAARIEILRSGKNRNLAISQLCEKLKWRAVICLTRVKKPDMEIATTLVVIDTDDAKGPCHRHIAALFTQAPRGFQAAASPLPSGNLASRYSAKIRQTSMADKIPASLPRRTTIADPM